VRALFASGLIVVVWGQYGFQTAAWPGADITSMALMATSPANRTAVSAAPNSAPKEVCHTWGNLHTGIHAQCTMLQWFRDPFQQWCRRQPTPPPACRPPAAPSTPEPDLALRQVGSGGYRPHRAEIVLFDDKIARWSAAREKSYRTGLVIGVPGDHVGCAGSGTPILVNGRPALRGSILFPTPPTAARAFDLTVPDGRLWVQAPIGMPSDDSSDHLDDPGGGTVPTSAVVAFFSR
jgi:hypothetical protein